MEINIKFGQSAVRRVVTAPFWHKRTTAIHEAAGYTSDEISLLAVNGQDMPSFRWWVTSHHRKPMCVFMVFPSKRTNHKWRLYFYPDPTRCPRLKKQFIEFDQNELSEQQAQEVFTAWVKRHLGRKAYKRVLGAFNENH